MNFFDQHGVITLICIALFPRLTLLIASFATGGVMWWLGWILAPHVLVAVLSLRYWDANPVLVVVAWIVALGGTGAEGKTASKAR